MRIDWRMISAGAAIAVSVWLTMAQNARAADVIVGVDVPARQRLPLNKIDHSAWDRLLQKYVDEQGRVDYTAWKNAAIDVRELDDYLQLLSHSGGKGTREEQLAFWINAYNAVTIKGILREYPTSSIRNHTAKLFGYNIWKDLKLVVGGNPVSLEDMEHKVLRKMDEPRIHFAIVCASAGCPRLLNEAYLAERLEQQLTANTKTFFTDSTKFRFDADKNIFYVSPILDWFGEDFGNSTSAQLQRIAPWLPDEAARQTASRGIGSWSFLDYDWKLNDRR